MMYRFKLSNILLFILSGMQLPEHPDLIAAFHWLL